MEKEWVAEVNIILEESYEKSKTDEGVEFDEWWREREKSRSRNYEVFAKVKSNLQVEEAEFIRKIIFNAQREHNIKREIDTYFYGEGCNIGEEIKRCIKFYLSISKYMEYFEILDYNSYFEGVINVTEAEGSVYEKIQ